MAKSGRSRREALRNMKGKNVRVLKNVSPVIRKDDILVRPAGKSYYVKKGETQGVHVNKIPLFFGLFKWRTENPNFLLAGAVESSPKYFEQI
jgi:hypothetical protein